MDGQTKVPAALLPLTPIHNQAKQGNGYRCPKSEVEKLINLSTQIERQLFYRLIQHDAISLLIMSRDENRTSGVKTREGAYMVPRQEVQSNMAHCVIDNG